MLRREGGGKENEKGRNRGRIKCKRQEKEWGVGEDRSGVACPG